MKLIFNLSTGKFLTCGTWVHSWLGQHGQMDRCTSDRMQSIMWPPSGTAPKKGPFWFSVLMNCNLLWRRSSDGRELDLLSRDQGCDSRPGTTMQQHRASYSHLCGLCHWAVLVLLVMPYGWEGNCGPGGKQWHLTAGLIFNITCRLTIQYEDQFQPIMLHTYEYGTMFPKPQWSG